MTPEHLKRLEGALMVLAATVDYPASYAVWEIKHIVREIREEVERP